MGQRCLDKPIDRRPARSEGFRRPVICRDDDPGTRYLANGAAAENPSAGENRDDSTVKILA